MGRKLTSDRMTKEVPKAVLIPVIIIGAPPPSPSPSLVHKQEEKNLSFGPELSLRGIGDWSKG